MPHARRSAGSNALHALVLLALLLGTAELAARVWGSRFLPRERSLDALPGDPVPQEPNMVADAATGWRARHGRQTSFGIPGGTYVNTLGMRAPELSAKADGARRMLFLGDSTVFGVLVPDGETFADRAGAKLRSVDPALEVLNGGVPGYSTWQALRALEARLLDLEPDLVVVGALWSDTQGAGTPDALRFPRSPFPWLAKVNAYYFTREWVNHLRYGGRPQEVTFGLAPAGETRRVPLPDYAANLRAIASTVRAAGGDVAFLVLPCIKDPAGAGVGDHRDDYRAAMRAAAAELGAPLVDTPPLFVGTRPADMFADEVHPTSAGHAVIADALVTTLAPWVAAARDESASAR